MYLQNDAVSGFLLYTFGVGLINPGICSIDNFGNLACSGTKSAVVPVDGGSRRVALYAVEAPENWFEDFGTGRLSNGEAIIRLEPTFAQTVNTGEDYHVFLTPRGECEGLYVAEVTGDAFTVRELHHGVSNVVFDYRIVARRKGYESIRLADKTKDFDGNRFRRAAQPGTPPPSPPPMRGPQVPRVTPPLALAREPVAK